ncbi:MAG: hypothetical protein AAFQ89_17485 [Cyanobacteria bacterium J06626_18]
MRVKFAFTALLCAMCLSSASSAVEAEAGVSEGDESVCQTDITWTRQSENQWISEDGLVVKLYNEADADSARLWYEEEVFAITTSSFWTSDNASEAEAILEEMIPGEEIDVTNFFRNRSWRIEIVSFGCSRGLKCIPEDPYLIQYLHRPAEDWVIDRLLTRAQGFVIDETDPADPRLITHAVVEGPYLPIFEGRFRQDGVTFWFSARDHDGITSYRTLLHEKHGILELSTSEARFETLREINDFLASCI